MDREGLETSIVTEVLLGSVSLDEQFSTSSDFPTREHWGISGEIFGGRKWGGGGDSGIAARL